MWVLDPNIATLYNHEVQITQSAMQNLLHMPVAFSGNLSLQHH